MPINSKVQLCGAKSKQNKHQPCKQPAVKYKKRCRLHGGLSTGPRTLEGRKRISAARFKHGFYTIAATLERLKMREMLMWKKDIVDS